MWTGWPRADRLGLVRWLGGSSLLPARRRAVLTAPADAGPCVWAAACESVCLCICVCGCWGLPGLLNGGFLSLLSRKQTEAPQLQGWDWKSRVPEPFTPIHFQKVRQKRIPCPPPLTKQWGPETGVAACPVCKALGSVLRQGSGGAQTRTGPGKPDNWSPYTFIQVLWGVSF